MPRRTGRNWCNARCPRAQMDPLCAGIDSVTCDFPCGGPTSVRFACARYVVRLVLGWAAARGADGWAIGARRFCASDDLERRAGRRGTPLARDARRVSPHPLGSWRKALIRRPVRGPPARVRRDLADENQAHFRRAFLILHQQSRAQLGLRSGPLLITGWVAGVHACQANLNPVGAESRGAPAMPDSPGGPPRGPSR